MKKSILSVAVLALSASSAFAGNFFAVKADPMSGGIEYVTELSSERSDCPQGFQFARTNLTKTGVPGSVPHSAGCWILMPNSKIMVSWINIATGDESQSHYQTSDFWTLQPAEYWWQFTPGFSDDEPEQAETQKTSQHPPLPQGGPVAQIMVPFDRGNFHLVYQLSRQEAAGDSCHAGARAVLISATDSKMFPRTVPYADGCWYKNRAHEIIMKAKAFDGSAEFVHSYMAEEFQQAEDFWTTATASQ